MNNNEKNNKDEKIKTARNPASIYLPIILFLVLLIGIAGIIYFLSFSSRLTVTFDTEGGEYIPPIVDVKSFEEIPAPTKQGYTFAGWYDNKNFEGGKLTNLPNKVGQVTLHANWRINQYRIDFASNGGSVVPTIVEEFRVPLTKPVDPIKTGFVFDGWFKDKALTIPYIFSTMPSENLTLYAKWSKLIEITLTPTEGITYGGFENTTIKSGEDFSFTVTPIDELKNSPFKIKANGVEISAKNEIYKIENVTEPITIVISH